MTPQTRWFSLRRRLIVWLLGGVTIGWLGAMGVVYVEARHELAKIHEYEARDEARDELRHELDEHFIKALLTPLLFGLPLLGGWIWFATWRGLRPLDEVAAELGKRDTHRTLYLFDEPTTGLHFADVQNLTAVYWTDIFLS